jgi:hypothetical protein
VVALQQYEGTLNSLGMPLAETMSPLADPDNPNRTHGYVAELPARDWAEYALEVEQRKPEWSGDNYLRSRHFIVRRVDFSPPDPGA